LPGPHRDDIKDFNIETAGRIDKARQDLGIPHIIHIMLDKYFKNVYRQLNRKDLLGQGPAQLIREYRDPTWWESIKTEDSYKRRKSASNKELREERCIIRNMKSSFWISWVLLGKQSRKGAMKRHG
jgi:hypothetical protein